MKFPFPFSFPIRRFSPLSHRTHQYTETNTYNNTYYTYTFTSSSTSSSLTFSSSSSSFYSSTDSDSLYSSSRRNFHSQCHSHWNSHSQSRSHNHMTRIRNIHFGRCHYHSQLHPLKNNSNSTGHWNNNTKQHSHPYTTTMTMTTPIPITFSLSHRRDFSSNTKTNVIIATETIGKQSTKKKTRKRKSKIKSRSTTLPTLTMADTKISPSPSPSSSSSSPSTSSSSSAPIDPKNTNKSNNNIKKYNNKNKKINKNNQSNLLIPLPNPSASPSPSPSQCEFLLSELRKLPYFPLPHHIWGVKYDLLREEFVGKIPKMTKKEERILRERRKEKETEVGREEKITIENMEDSRSLSPSPFPSISNSELLSFWFYCFEITGGRFSFRYHSLSPFYSIYKEIMMSPLLSITLVRVFECEIYPSPSPPPSLSPMEIMCFSLVAIKFNFPQSLDLIQMGWKKMVKEILTNGIPQSLSINEKETQRKTSASSFYSSNPYPLSSLPPPPLTSTFDSFISSSSPPISLVLFSEYLDSVVFSLALKKSFVNEKFKEKNGIFPHLFEGIFHHLLSNYLTLPAVSEQYLCVSFAFRALINLSRISEFHHLYLSFWPYFVRILSSFPDTLSLSYPQLLVSNLYGLVTDPLKMILSFEDKRSFKLSVQPLTNRFLTVLTSPSLLSTWTGKESEDFFISVRSNLFVIFLQVTTHDLLKNSPLAKFTVDTLIPLVHSLYKRKVHPYDDIKIFWQDLSLAFKVIQHGAKSLPYLSILSLVCDMSNHCQSLSHSNITLPSKVLFPLTRLMGIIGVSSKKFENHFIDATHQWISNESDSRRRELSDVISFFSFDSYGGRPLLQPQIHKADITLLLSMIRQNVRSATQSLQKVLKDHRSSDSQNIGPLSQYEEYNIFHRYLWSVITFAITTTHYSLLIDVIKLSWSTVQSMITHTPTRHLRLDFIRSLRDLRRFLQYVTPWATGRLPNMEILWSEKMEKIFAENSRETERTNGGKTQKMKRFIPTMRGALERVKRKVEGERDKEHKEMGIHMNIISLLDNPTGNSDFDSSSLFIPFKVEFTWKHQKHSDIPISNSTPTHTPHVTPTPIVSANPSPFFSFYLCLLGTHDHLYDCHKALDVEMRIKAREERKRRNSSSSSPSPSPSDSISNSESDSFAECSAVSNGIQFLSPTKIRNSSQVELIIMRNIINTQESKQSPGVLKLLVLPPHHVSAFLSEKNCELTANQIHLRVSQKLKEKGENKRKEGTKSKTM